MKTLRTRYFIFCLCVCTLIFSCGFNSAPVTDDYVQFRIVDINFEKGNWNFFYDSGFDTIEYENSRFRDFNRKIKFEYDYDSYIANINIPVYDKTITHTYQHNGLVIDINSFTTHFSNSFYRQELPSHESSYESFLKNGYTNDLSFTYSISGYSFSGLKGAINIVDGGKIAVIDDPEQRFDAEVAIIKPSASSKNFKNSINMVVMADGYDKNDIQYFERYVWDAFKDESTFHFTEYRNTHDHIPNRFFEKYWKNDINVIMVKSISKDSGIDTVAGVNKKNSILDVNSDISGEKFNSLGYGEFTNISNVINRNFEKIGLHPDYIDVIIIFVNQSGRAYASIDDHFYNKRNSQPVNRTIIPAPREYDENNLNFHNYVQTDSIAHELGHAFARLQDEYIEIDRSNYEYSASYRNIDLVTNQGSPKWNRLRNANSNFFTSSVPNKDTDHRIGNFVGGLYHANKYIRSTYESTMKGDGKSNDYQFGPVNTYHLAGSFETRMGNIDPQDPGYMVGEMNIYEWRGYSFNDFCNKWGINDFNY